MLIRVWRELGVGALLVEQSFDFSWAFTNQPSVMQRGCMVEEGETAIPPSSAVHEYMTI